MGERGKKDIFPTYLIICEHGSRYCAVEVRAGLIGRCVYAENGGKNGVNGSSGTDCM
ncbi:hypothetical protein HBH70_238990 [Parastagonospora nodorum]|uniref:Uncharacterized protein n=1 Tax=Phaeosphaeria nodorum (strain SN15 / ATCC MYA-4574 / FGSC 10173) TaxID=321614 RepID=A0A7U2HZZ5_PHANO|nr:hypothetical protein HBH54_021580 [Parastagonospora nodorum]QRC94816.1 hypothetical protein JI435_406400 [Parastagonospora nodorum SN15]KAH3953833.1 hypothetical protein HBH53_033980 [Parastagonospora nodorum]KAH3969502.1 hypothetical protein HBH51_126130 [Parastagonospora nodorum]KAH3990527.1 hypothetical protein HBH52_011000 [Parastagonospora nodorum]